MPNGYDISHLHIVVICLAALAVLLAVAAYRMRCGTARVYNWDGKRFCYLGRAALHRDGAGYRIAIGERMADLSYTTLYRICPSRRFVRRNRYQDMVLSAGREKCMLPIEECMERSVYYRPKR